MTTDRELAAQLDYEKECYICLNCGETKHKSEKPLGGLCKSCQRELLL